MKALLVILALMPTFSQAALADTSCARAQLLSVQLEQESVAYVDGLTQALSGASKMYSDTANILEENNQVSSEGGSQMPESFITRDRQDAQSFEAAAQKAENAKAAHIKKFKEFQATLASCLANK